MGSGRRNGAELYAKSRCRASVWLEFQPAVELADRRLSYRANHLIEHAVDPSK
jgi:hypothetical protein